MKANLSKTEKDWIVEVKRLLEKTGSYEIHDLDDFFRASIKTDNKPKSPSLLHAEPYVEITYRKVGLMMEMLRPEENYIGRKLLPGSMDFNPEEVIDEIVNKKFGYHYEKLFDDYDLWTSCDNPDDAVKEVEKLLLGINKIGPSIKSNLDNLYLGLARIVTELGELIGKEYKIN